MTILQYGQEILFITNDGLKLDCHMFDNFDAVIRYYKNGTGHESDTEMKVYGLQHGHMLSASGNNKPYSDQQIVVSEGEIVIYREDRYIAIYMGDYSDALRFEPVSAHTHCLEDSCEPRQVRGVEMVEFNR